MINTVAMADDYFSDNYFGADAWSALTVKQKEMLIGTAEIDISMALRSELDPAVVIRKDHIPPYKWLYLNGLCTCIKTRKRLPKK